MKLSRWDVVGALCLVGFGVAWFALLTERGDDGPPPEEQLLDPSTDVQLGDEWMGLYFRGDRVGLMHVNKAARDEGGYRFTFETRLRLMAFHRDAPLDLTVQADLDPELALQRFEFAVDAGPAKLSGEGTVDDTTIQMALLTGGQTVNRTIELTHPPVLRSNIGPLLSRTDLKPGTKMRYHAFDPLTQTDQPVDIEVVGPESVLILDREVPATRIRTTVGGLTLNGWMNARGEMLRQEMGLGLVAVRETREQARFGLLPAGRNGADLIAATQVKVSGLPPDLKGRARLKLALDGIETASFEMEDRRQTLADGVLTITRESVGAGLPLPVFDPPEGSLEPDALVQSDHPHIRRQAKSIVGDAKDTLVVARKLSDWLGENIEQRAVAGVPSALDVLKSKVGDCNEHSVLFAALARSLGVPTRVVVGLVYADGAFGYHAWNEVLGAEGWVSVDATWQQLPVDVGHVALLRGGLGQHARLLPVIGRLRLKVVP